jgi:hypothetical protein
MRRPGPFEIQLPAEPAARWLERAVALLVAGALSAWVWGWATQANIELSQRLSMAVLLALVTVLTCERWAQREGAGDPWLLAFDGQQWAWACLASSGAVRQGQGTLHLALSMGPWCLLRARATGSREVEEHEAAESASSAGQSAWMWVRPQRLGVQGHRLAVLLNWS